MLPSPGSYRAKQNGTVIVRAEESGSLMAYIPFMLTNCSEVANFAGIYAMTLATKVGEPQKKNIQALKTVFPNWEIETLSDIEMPADGGEIPQFDLADCFHDSYTPDGADEPIQTFKAKWFNPVGGGVRKQPMNDEERKAVIAKYKSKFKALGLLGGAAAAPAEKEEKKSTPAPSGKKTPPDAKNKNGTGGVALTANMDEVFQVFTELPENKKKNEDQMAEAWYAKLDEKFGEGTSSNPDLTIQQWGELKGELEA